MPTIKDDVYITLPGQYGVTVSSQAAMAQSLTLGRDCQSMDCPSLSKPRLTLRNSLTVNGTFVAWPESYVNYEYTSLNIHITVNDDLQNLALMSMNARVTFAGTGIIINSGVFKVERQSSSWRNIFNINFTNHGILDFEPSSSDTSFNAVLHNEMSGIVVINGQNVRDGTINNTGVIVMKNTGTRAISMISSRLLNYGQIQIQMGTLAVTGSLENSGSIEINGILRCSALTMMNESNSAINGGLVQLTRGTHDLQGGTFRDGLITIESSAVVTVSGYIELSRLQLLEGTIHITTETLAAVVLYFRRGTIFGYGNTLESSEVIIPDYTGNRYFYNTTLIVSKRFTVQASSQTLYVYMHTDTTMNMLEGSLFKIGSDQKLSLDQRDSSRCLINVQGNMTISGELETDVVFILTNGDLGVLGTGQLRLIGPGSFLTSNVFVSRYATLWLNGRNSRPIVSFSVGTHIHNNGHIRASTPVVISPDSTVFPTFGQISCDVDGRFEISARSSGLKSIRWLTISDSCEVVITDAVGDNNTLTVNSISQYRASLRLNTNVVVGDLYVWGSSNFYLNENYTYSIMGDLKIDGPSERLSFVGVGSSQGVINVIGQLIVGRAVLYVQSATMRLHSRSYFIQANNVILQDNGFLEVMPTSRLLVIDSDIRVAGQGTLLNHGILAVAGSQSHIYSSLVNNGTILLSRDVQLNLRASSSHWGSVRVEEYAAVVIYTGQHVFHPGSFLDCHQGNII